RSISTPAAATLAVTGIIIIVIAAYAGLTLASNTTDTSITCSESVSQFTVVQNGTASELTLSIPDSPCQHHITLSSFSLATTAGADSSMSLSGNVYVNSTSPLSALVVYVNGSFETTTNLVSANTRPYTIQFNAILSNTVQMIAGAKYRLEFVALFRDHTATTATTTVNLTS
ncbi:MAG: hypothetical protein ACRDF4_05795, partial [Rhabdochlamydiaceae bacterium]